MRRLGSELGCQADEEAILAARSAADPAEYANALVRRSGTGFMLLDFGFPPLEAWSPSEHRRQLRIPQREIVRLETLAEELVAECEEPDDWLSGVRRRVREAVANGAAAVKTIAAYRASLRLTTPGPSELSRDFAELRAQAGRGMRPRVAGDSLCHALVYTAAEECGALGVPLQVHCGLGDPDEDLEHASPLGLRPLLADPRFTGLKLVLLHCYPYQREAAYLSAMYPDVYMDLSLAIPLAGADGSRAMREALGLCPWTKLLYATDASRIPELYFVAAQLHREALAEALSELIGRGTLTAGEAADAGRQVLSENARALYRIVNTDLAEEA